MIPVKLSLHNFICYRDNVPPLSFEGIHVACLCGDNGHGKSALLDAMTWALWGKARAKSDEDLVHTGRTEMGVEFEFQVGQNRYCVVRKYAKSRPGKPGQTSLDCYIAGEAGFRPISGNSQRETQGKISDILHMDYNTFINSSFLVQGRADEFTNKRPGERKDILGNILGLAVYDDLERQAKERAKQREAELLLLEKEMAAIDAELEHRNEYQAELDEVQKALETVAVQTKGCELALDELRQKKANLEYVNKQLEQIKIHIGDEEKYVTSLEQRLAGYRIRIAGYEELLSSRAMIEKGYTEFCDLKKESDELNEKLRLLAGIREKRGHLAAAIGNARGKLEVECKGSRDKIAQAEAKGKKLPWLNEESERARARIGEIEQQGGELEVKREQVQQLLAQVKLLESQGTGLKKEIAEVDEKLTLLAKSVSHCPLCERELGPEDRATIEQKYRAERQAKLDACRLNQAEFERKKVLFRQSTEEVARSDGALKREREAWQNRMTTLKRDITDAELDVAELSREHSTLAKMEERLQNGDFAAAEQAELRDLDNRSLSLGYDPQRHEKVKQQLKELGQYELQKRRLEEAEASLARDRNDLAWLDQEMTAKKQILEEAIRKRQGLTGELAAWPVVLRRLGDAEQEYKTTVAQERQLRDRAAAVQEKLRRCEQLASSRLEKERTFKQLATEKEIYGELALAYGKKGVQAFLIEQYLPEIELEADRLLARMTDNRMHLKIETQRESKKGDTIETLDINISDEMGTRSYEMFSGGEAFRINFALRIALSKLLAHRAGAPLPTLIMDEGFGTQDSAGREKLIEAINSIKDDFEKILVITHIEELKDAFPVRIDVTKTAEGAMFSLS